MRGMAMMIVALGVLIIPGALYNNLNNNGLAVSPTQSLSCSSDVQTPTCQISGNVGCQASSNYCTLSGSTISFLSASSPFTQLIGGNLFALFQNPAIGSTAHGMFDASPGYSYYPVDCWGQQNGGSGLTKWAVNHCTQVSTDNKNLTVANTQAWPNWNTNWVSSLNNHLYILGNGSFPLSCRWMATINYTLLANGPGWNYYGCSVYDAVDDNSHRIWPFLLAFPTSAGAFGAGVTHQFIYAQLLGWDAYRCTTVSAATTSQCNAFINQFKGTPIYTSGNSVVNFQPSGGLAILGFFAGIILVLGGLGIGFTSSVLGYTINRQGTKLFQVIGLGLIIWSLMYSQFSTWFTSNLLPYGLDGSTGIISLILTGLFWFGVYTQTTSDGSG